MIEYMARINSNLSFMRVPIPRAHRIAQIVLVNRFIANGFDQRALKGCAAGLGTAGRRRSFIGDEGLTEASNYRVRTSPLRCEAMSVFSNSGHSGLATAG